MTTALVTLDILGREIKARIDAGDKAASRAENHYIAAGQQLVEARKRVEAEGGSFRSFLEAHYIGRSRAYDILAVADGRKTFAGIRAKAAERAAKHAGENRAARLSVTNGQETQRTTADVEPTEIRVLKEKLANSESQRLAQESLANIADKQARDAANRAMFAEADKERLFTELAEAKKEIDRLHRLLSEDSSRSKDTQFWRLWALAGEQARDRYMSDVPAGDAPQPFTPPAHIRTGAFA